MASELLGAVISEALRALIEEVKVAKESESLFKKLQSTMNRLLPITQEMIEKVPDHDVGELNELKDTIERAKLVVSKRPNVRWWEKSKYAREIEEVDKDLLNFCQKDLAILGYKKLVELTALVKNTRKKDNSSISSELFSVPNTNMDTVGLDLPLKKVKKKLRDDTVSDLVVTAPPGCGKTTLVTQHAEIKERFKESVVSSTPNSRNIVQKWLLENLHQDETNYHLDCPKRSSPLVNSQSAAFEMAVQPGTSEDKSHGRKKVDETPLKHVELPAIEDLQISGEPYPGHELQACGFSINGTTSCNFEWVCHLEDGSVNYIDGAKQPNYLVTADDVDLYLAIEVQPLDDRNRKGELVKVFANDNRKIACQPKMQSHIEKTLHNGHASYNVSLATGFMDIWEAATLSINREGYSIKCHNDHTIAEKFSASTAVTIPFGQPAEFVIIGSDGIEHTLRAYKPYKGLTNLTCSRDAIVLALRSFIMRALQRNKGKKRGFLFK